MTARPIRWWFVCLGMMLGLVLKATPTAQQCYLDISAYASGIVSGYDASGNGVVDYYGSGFDYSWCDGIECVHAYAIEGTIKQLPSQQVWDQVQGEGTEFSQSVGVTPGEYRVESLFYAGCWQCAQQVFVTQASQAIQVPQQPGCGDERDTMINEYRAGVVYPNGVSPIPGCADFEYHSSSHQYLTNFTWGERTGTGARETRIQAGDHSCRRGQWPADDAGQLRPGDLHQLRVPVPSWQRIHLWII